MDDYVAFMDSIEKFANTITTYAPAAAFAAFIVGFLGVAIFTIVRVASMTK